ncbi:hypothetical protein TNCV_1468801 [Trichonephila clavipes]|uniref:Uncharacterized protein n=1 Tax=Trichonephila clavipes TaxID=2585209 RepID=A0A8X6S7H7_TRICX|nr:hypothetical protein TNCV_1468801 [Trichonephila clavipes]
MELIPIEGIKVHMTPGMDPRFPFTQTPLLVSAIWRVFPLSTTYGRRIFSGTGLELVTRPATIRYLDHSTTVAPPPMDSPCPELTAVRKG